MECKFCGKELEEGQKVCKRCAALMEEEMNGKKVKKEPAEKVPAWKIAVAAVILLVMMALLFTVVYHSITDEWPFGIGSEETTEASESAEATESTRTPASELGFVLPEVTNIPNYTVDDAVAVEKGDEVVATYEDKYELTNSLLQVYYFTEFGDFVTEATEAGYDVATAYGLDITKPLSEQYVMDYDCTWEQYFLHEALYSWWKDAVINGMADGADYHLSEEDLAILESAADQLSKNVQEEGYSDVEEMVDDRLGAACDLEDYVQYLKFKARAEMYKSVYMSTYEPTAEQVDEFFTINEEYYYSNYGITKESGKGVNVRHVLIKPEGFTQNQTTGYTEATDEQWEACRKEAQALLDEWAKNPSEESFGELAVAHSVDGSASVGGLYQNVYQGRMVEAFDQWIFDENRKSGDYGLIKTEYGYHLMYFVSANEEEVWYVQAKNDAIAYAYGFNMEVTEKMSGNMLEPQYTLVCLSDISQEAPAEEETTEPTEATQAETAAPTEG